MKKVFFAFVAASVVVLAACNNKPAETETACC
jgi:predicted small secreted protein